MKISKHEEYGLRCILQLARADFGKVIPVTEIARCEGLSTAYVTKLFTMLCKSDLVAGIRGVHGGYTLKRPPEQISVGEVLRPLGGFFYSKETCSEFPGKLHECCHMGGCGIRPLWMLLSMQIYSFLNRTKLSDLLMQEKDVERILSARVPQNPAVAAGQAV